MKTATGTWDKELTDAVLDGYEFTIYTPLWLAPRIMLFTGKCEEVLPSVLLPNSLDSIVTDPPYELGFMGKEWDSSGIAFSREMWAECFRVLKPGGHLLSFGGTRTWHRMAVAIEDAGFEIRDSIAWLYGSGFPKSLDVSKAIDRRRDWSLVERLSGEIRRARAASEMSLTEIGQATLAATNGAYGKWYHRGGHMFFETGRSLPSRPEWEHLRHVLPIAPEFAEVYDEAEREVTGVQRGAMAGWSMDGGTRFVDRDITAPATPDAQTWQGWGTALKPGHEPVVCARKPFNTVPLGEEVDRLHHLIGGLLWLSLSPAKRAELASPSSPAGQHGARCASALVSAATATSPDGFAQTGMCSSPATASTSSSIASSWSSILGALSALTSTSTTSTRSSTTTALTTLSSLLAPLTSPSTMPPCACLTSGSSSSAPSAGSDSTDEWARWLHTLSASVPASAIEGTALVVASALAQVAASLSADQGAASSADPSATTGADASPSPAFEPIVVARKPFRGTVAANVLAHGTGALNIDACRIATDERIPNHHGTNGAAGLTSGARAEYVPGSASPENTHGKGRWPANVILSEDQATELGEAARFFYCAKAPTSERPKVDGQAHATVKPLTLMRWLVQLVTPPGGIVGDPFAGSGTTLEAAYLEGFSAVGVELEDIHIPLIRQRLEKAQAAKLKEVIP